MEGGRGGEKHRLIYKNAHYSIVYFRDRKQSKCLKARKWLNKKNSYYAAFKNVFK